MPTPDANKLVGRWPVPVKGVVLTLPSHELGVDTLSSASNVMISRGYLQERPGLTAFGAQTFADRPIGGSLHIAPSGSTTLLVATRQRLFKYDTAWADVTGTLLTGTADQLARFALLEFGSPEVVYAVMTNGVDLPRAWSGTGNFANLGGTPSPPLWTDITNAFDRIVGVVPPYKVTWGEQATLDKWPVINTRFLAETPDPIICISGRGLQGVIVYKRKSIWVGTPQGGSSAFAFTFAPREYKDGPAGVHARVLVEGTDYYMTLDGKIGSYDGFTHAWVGDGLWPLLSLDIDPIYANRTVAWYDPTNRVVCFAYPRLGDNGSLKGLAIVNTLYAEQGISTIACFPGVLGRPVAAAFNYWLGADPTERVMILGDDTTKKPYTWTGVDDDGELISGHWQLSFVPTPGLLQMRMDLVEAFLARGDAYGEVLVRPVLSSILDTPSGTYAPHFTINLSETPVYSHNASGGDARGRFFGLRFEFEDATIRYAGSLAYGRAA